MIIDRRLHPPPPTWVRQLQFTRGDDYYRFQGFERPASTRTLFMDLLVAEMDRSRVRWDAIMGRQAADPLGVIPNDEIAECISAHPNRFVGWAR